VNGERLTVNGECSYSHSANFPGNEFPVCYKKRVQTRCERLPQPVSTGFVSQPSVSTGGELVKQFQIEICCGEWGVVDY
jgi:hypothetical protein